MTAHEEIADALDKLAAHGSADQIAAHLAEQGHVGVRVEPDQCPVSNYLHATTNARVSVGRYSWAQVDNWSSWGRTPLTIGKFIGEFDHGAHSELNAGRAES